jgi:hypothetical protein
MKTKIFAKFFPKPKIFRETKFRVIFAFHENEINVFVTTLYRDNVGSF